ncbi:MAG: hypothetical protein R3F65_25580 [bacterium]
MNHPPRASTPSADSPTPPNHQGVLLADRRISERAAGPNAGLRACLIDLGDGFGVVFPDPGGGTLVGPHGPERISAGELRRFASITAAARAVTDRPGIDGQAWWPSSTAGAAPPTRPRRPRPSPPRHPRPRPPPSCRASNAPIEPDPGAP